MLSKYTKIAAKNFITDLFLFTYTFKTISVSDITESG